ncbi:MAG: hypothetical protein ABIZ70_03545 [Gemmatimonadales bacterium]
MARERGLRAAGGKRLSETGSSRLLQQIQAEVLEELEVHAAAAAIPVAPRTAPSGWLAAAMLSWIAVAALVFFRPALTRGPVAEVVDVPPAQRAASNRYGIWLADAAVRRFYAKQHRMPSFLGEAGVADTTVRMRVTGEKSYELEAGDAEAPLTFVSGGSIDAFLGESVQRLRGE